LSRLRPGRENLIRDQARFDHRKALGAGLAEKQIPAIECLTDRWGTVVYPHYLLRWADEVGQALNGVAPADIPIQQPTKLILSINLKTAKAIGLDVPSTLVLRADQLIE